MSDTIIQVENLSKSYIIGHQRQESYTALRDVMANGAKNLCNKIFSPFTLHPSPLSNTTEEFFALRDVSFEIKQGDRVGIIGRNGAGKSTLLKILSRITEPSSGRVTITGRVASLLEVGTGFHPELTGRENVFLNGAILGMSRVEIKRKFDEIVAFAEVERFLDTPVKRYSSGMYVRLAFAVAAHLEPEILIVDEVLAVGDVQFQKKCLGKMDEVGKCGRTILFVSHNMGAVKNLCNRAMLLDKGGLFAYDDTGSVIDSYINNYSGLIKNIEPVRSGNGKVRFRNYRLVDEHSNDKSEFFMGDTVAVCFELEFNANTVNPMIGLEIRDILNNPVMHIMNQDDSFVASACSGDRYTVKVEIPYFYLGPNEYIISLWIGNLDEVYDYVIDCCKFSLIIGDRIKRLTTLPSHINIFLPSKWSKV